MNRSAPAHRIAIIKRMTAVSFETPTEFNIKEIFTFGVENCKFGGYNVPIKFNPESEFLTLLKDTARKNGATLKLYGSELSTLYLKCDQLTEKQKYELLDEKMMIIDIEFSAVGTRVVKGELRLSFEVTGLRKVRSAKILKPAPRD